MKSTVGYCCVYHVNKIIIINNNDNKEWDNNKSDISVEVRLLF